MKSDKRNNPRLYANSGSISEEYTVFEKGVFTSCKYREGEKCPPWIIQAKKLNIIVQKNYLLQRCSNEDL